MRKRTVLLGVAICLVCLICLAVWMAGGKLFFVTGEAGKADAERAAEETGVAAMTAEELVEEITADKYFGDILAWSGQDYTWPVYRFSKKCEALEELMKREDAAQAVLSAIQSRNETIMAYIQDPTIEMGKAELERDTLWYILEYLLFPEKQKDV